MEGVLERERARERERALFTVLKREPEHLVHL